MSFSNDNYKRIPSIYWGRSSWLFSFSLPCNRTRYRYLLYINYIFFCCKICVFRKCCLSLSVISKMASWLNISLSEYQNHSYNISRQPCFFAPKRKEIKEPSMNACRWEITDKTVLECCCLQYWNPYCSQGQGKVREVVGLQRRNSAFTISRAPRQSLLVHFHTISIYLEPMPTSYILFYSLIFPLEAKKICMISASTFIILRYVET